MSTRRLFVTSAIGAALLLGGGAAASAAPAGRALPAAVPAASTVPLAIPLAGPLAARTTGVLTGGAPAAGTPALRVLAADPIAPVAPIDQTTPGQQTGPSVTVDPGTLISDSTMGGMTSPLSIVLLLGLVSVVPALLIMVTAFTRIVIVLGFTRTALSAQGIPPNQVVVGLALFLTLFVMAPTFSAANKDAFQPYLKGEITAAQAYDRGSEPFKEFMLKQVRERDLGLFVKLSGKPKPADATDLPITTIVPAFVISELRTAFLIGFVIFLPFLVIDVVVATALQSMGMVMLPPVLISLPFKLLLFVAADGWYLVVQSLVTSFNTS